MNISACDVTNTLSIVLLDLDIKLKYQIYTCI